MGERSVMLGIGGWEHEVLDECLYPAHGMSSAEKLRYYSEVFDFAEVRATFWDEALSASDAREWADAVAGNRRFQFAVKLPARMSHKREFTPGAARNFRGLLQELARRNRLGAVLVQTPFSFTNTSAGRFHLVRIAEMFCGFPLYVELRHASWSGQGLRTFLEEHGLRSVSTDLPRMRQYMPFLTTPAGDTPYLRLHGRNERGWLVDATDARYDYLYNAREIVELRRRVDAMAPRGGTVIVSLNNTTGGKAVANALQLRSALAGGARIQVPEPALRAFPILKEVAAERESGGLFDTDDYRVAM